MHTSIAADLGWTDFTSGHARMRYALYQLTIIDGTPHPSEAAFEDARFFTWAQIATMRDQLSPNAAATAKRYATSRLTLLENLDARQQLDGPSRACRRR